MGKGKAKLRQWQANPPWSKDDPRWTVTQKGGMGFTTLGGKDEKHAKLAEKALNSYNPKRDRLARGLADALVRYARCYPQWRTHKPFDKAHELLALCSPKGSSRAGE